MEVFTTESGFRYAVRSYGSNVGYCALSIHVGTRDESGYHSGIAHFLEHTLFKGTSRKSSTVINNTLERLGGELNAYTTKEEIVLHATVLKQDLAKAAALLMEIATDAQFPEDEIEIEKGVVIDEIASYKDFPAEEIYDRFEEKLFAGTDLSRPILGTEDSVRAITSDELRKFRREFFTPDRMVMTMVSPLDECQMKKIIGKVIASCEMSDAQCNVIAVAETGTETMCVEQVQVLESQMTTSHNAPLNFSETVNKNNNEANCVIGGLAPSLNDNSERIATLLLCNMLGGPATSSILTASLREKHGWVYNVECNYTPYSDTGIASINFGCDKENLSKCIRAIYRELGKITAAPISQKRLAAAKRQILGQNAIGQENGEAQCLSMGKSILSFGKIAAQTEIEQLIAGVTPQMLHEAAQKIFSKEKLSTLIFI